MEREGERCSATVSGAKRLTPAGRGKALIELVEVVDGRDMVDEVDLLTACGMPGRGVRGSEGSEDIGHDAVFVCRAGKGGFLGGTRKVDMDKASSVRARVC